jgi:hypothetical protein
MRKPSTSYSVLALVPEGAEETSKSLSLHCTAQELTARVHAAVAQARRLQARMNQATERARDIVATSRERRRERQSARECPECGSDRVASISYGRPSSETLQEFAAGLVVFGGVLERENAPQWLCRECEHRWRDAPA